MSSSPYTDTMTKAAGMLHLELVVDGGSHSVAAGKFQWVELLSHIGKPWFDELVEKGGGGELPVEGWLEVGRLTTLQRCSYCGKYPMYETNGAVLRTVDRCANYQGLALDYDIVFGSGSIVVADDLRPVFDVEGDFELNTAYGNVELSLALAEIGCAYGAVGNSSPSIYRLDDGHYSIASPGWDPETDETIVPPGEAVAWICTDLWAYSIADEAEFMRRGGEKFIAAHASDAIVDPTVVTVKPGVYRFNHHSFRRGFDRDDYTKPTVFADFHWVSPVVDESTPE